jgi:hypothetical protein
MGGVPEGAAGAFPLEEALDLLVGGVEAETVAKVLDHLIAIVTCVMARSKENEGGY